MASSVRDILGLRPSEAVSEKERPSRERAPKKPEGMSREAFALLDSGARHALPSSSYAVTKRLLDKKKPKRPKGRRSVDGKPSWSWMPFTNSAREDGLQLYHWARSTPTPMGRLGTMTEDGSYAFAKFNKTVKLVQYNDEEYKELLSGDPDWSREETDYLMTMCARYDLRFVIMADRYAWEGKNRSVEDLKERYYTVARKLVIAREGDPDAVAQHPLVKQAYNAQHERTRKKALELMLSRSGAEEREEEGVLEQARKIEERRMKEAEMERIASAAAIAAGPSKLNAPLGPQAEQDLQQMREEVDKAKDLAVPFEIPGSEALTAVPTTGVYLRGQHMQMLAEKMFEGLPGAARMTKRTDTQLGELGIHGVRMPTRRICAAYLLLRNEISRMLDLRGKLAQRQASRPSDRTQKEPSEKGTSKGSVATEGGEAQGSPPRPSSTGLGLVAADTTTRKKRKPPSRFDDTILTPAGRADKRSRKKKASEA